MANVVIAMYRLGRYNNVVDDDAAAAWLVMTVKNGDATPRHTAMTVIVGGSSLTQNGWTPPHEIQTQ